MADLTTTLRNVGSAVAVIAGLAMVLSLGIGQVFQVIWNPDAVDDLGAAKITADTLAAYGGQIDIVDRVLTAMVGITLLGPAAFGVIRQSNKNWPVLNTVLKYSIPVSALLGLTAFSDVVGDIIMGDFDYSLVSDATAAYYLFITGMVAAAVGSLFRR